MQISVLEGYRTPKSGHHRKARSAPKRKGRSNFGAAARACAAKGNKPGTKSFGSCMRTALKK
jgi:hypothetical protein